MTGRRIAYLVIHTTASGQHCTAADEQRHFLEDLKWSVGGYHKMVEANGRAVRLYADEVITNGTYPFLGPGILINNRNALHVAWIGGINAQGQPVDNRTAAQLATLRNLVFAWLARYPKLRVLGHGQVRAKACPCFDVPAWCDAIGVPAANVYPGRHFGTPAVWQAPVVAPLATGTGAALAGPERTTRQPPAANSKLAVAGTSLLPETKGGEGQ